MIDHSKWKRISTRTALKPGLSRLVVLAVAIFSAAALGCLAQFTDAETPLESAIQAGLNDPEYDLDALSVYVAGFLLTGWLVSQLVFRLQVRTLQRAMGGLYIDGVAGPRMAERALELKLLAGQNSEQTEPVDVAAILFPEWIQEIEEERENPEREIPPWMQTPIEKG